MTGNCFWFGHMPSAVTLADDIKHEGFVCRRCGKYQVWQGRLLAEVIRARSRLGYTPAQGEPQ